MLNCIAHLDCSINERFVVMLTTASFANMLQNKLIVRLSALITLHMAGTVKHVYYDIDNAIRRFYCALIMPRIQVHYHALNVFCVTQSGAFWVLFSRALGKFILSKWPMMLPQQTFLQIFVVLRETKHVHICECRREQHQITIPRKS